MELDMAVSTNRGPFVGVNKSPTTLGSILGPLIFGNSHIGLDMGDMSRPL